MIGVPEDKAPQTLSNTAFVSVEVVDGSNQDKTYMEAESAATGTKEAQKPENDFEMEATEAFGLHEVTCQTSTANELKAESQSKAQNQDTPFAKHPDFEGETTETISTCIEEHNKVRLRKSYGNKHFRKTESAVIDNDKRCRQENELPNMADVEVSQQLGQPKNVAKVCAKNEEHADCRSEASNEECVSKKHIKAEGKVTRKAVQNQATI
ncbi:hypothetical protein VNO77_25727 [Canavalia gladiata]|uniref:Uncharacterized protein n=1 Tax=Canavalia gladiata TaxID=3824 RepID=A0AAN9KU13_CANGL